MRASKIHDLCLVSVFVWVHVYGAGVSVTTLSPLDSVCLCAHLTSECLARVQRRVQQHDGVLRLHSMHLMRT